MTLTLPRERLRLATLDDYLTLFKEPWNGTAINTNVWTVTDTTSKLSVSGGVLNCSGGQTSYDDPMLVKTVAIPRRSGLVLQGYFRATAVPNVGPVVGWSFANNTFNINNNSGLGFLIDDSGGTKRLGLREPGAIRTLKNVTIPYECWFRIMLLTTGSRFYFSEDGKLTWQLAWEETTSTNTPLYVHVNNYNAAWTLDNLSVFQTVPKPAIVSDTFTRADSALTLGSAETGQPWTAVTGTWGISANKAYSASDADEDLASISASKADGIMDWDVLGTLNSGVTYRVPECVFRLDDASNYLYVRLLNGAVSLRKNDADVHSELATAAQTTADNTSYTIRVLTLGNVIRVYVAGTLKIAYTLAGGDTKYAAYTSYGMRLAKAGSPGTAATWDNLSFQGGL